LGGPAAHPIPKVNCHQEFLMPYVTQSYCSFCTQSDEFAIGLWPEHLGVFICPTCKTFVNVPLAKGQCSSCGYQPSIQEFYDYAPFIPYGRQDPNKITFGPLCPKCQHGKVYFETLLHLNVGRLGLSKDGSSPWLGRDYLEKAIFVHAVMGACAELDLQPDEILNYYSVDVPHSLMTNRKLSQPILRDIKYHLFAVASSGDTPFQVSVKFKEENDKLTRRAR